MSITKSENLWRILAISMCILAMCIISLNFLNFLDRVNIKNRPVSTISNKVFIISNESKRDILEFIQQEPNVVAISTISISLVTNKRESTFFHSTDPKLQEEWSMYQARHEIPPDVFSTNVDNNLRIARIINGNFECRKTINTIIPKMYHAEKYAPLICSISVPASFDQSADFVGYINFFIKSEQLSDSERKRLSKKAIDISTNIYNRDMAQHKK